MRKEPELPPHKTLKKERLIDGINSGRGVYTACYEEYKKRMRPARVSINSLGDALKLLQPPQIATTTEQNRALDSIKSHLQLNQISLLKIDVSKREKEFNKLIDRLITKNRENNLPESPNALTPQIPIESQMRAATPQQQGFELDDDQITALMESEIQEGESGVELTNQQKHILYNMLIAEGCTPQEAKEEIENINNQQTEQ